MRKFEEILETTEVQSDGDFDRVETMKARITPLRDAMGLKNEELY